MVRQSTALIPAATQLKPAIAPTTAWEEETGKPRLVAICSHKPQAISTDTIPIKNTCGLAANTCAFTTPVARVSETPCPNSTAPENSSMPATIIACRSVSAFEPTDVPIELATSLAPKLAATYKASAAIAPSCRNTTPEVFNIEVF